MEDYKLVLCTGAPGSAWSMISNRVKKTFRKGFDDSDETPERRYYIPEEHKKEYDVKAEDWQGTTHVGSYFGPYHEFGHGFDDIAKNYSTESFFTECLKPFQKRRARYKLVRSHWFAYNLDWIWENCKGHKLFLIWREAEASRDWWYSMGGWDIHYPVYKWYENPDRMWEKIQEESKLMWDFGQRKNIVWDEYGDDWVKQRWPDAEEKDYKASPKFKDIIKVAYVDIV
jgi:hypothetical protein